IVEVDGLLHEREAEALTVELDRLLRVRADTRDVMKTAQHGPAALLQQPVEPDRVREEEHRDHNGEPRQVALDDVRTTLGGRREAHAAETRVTSRVHEDQGDE